MEELRFSWLSPNDLPNFTIRKSNKLKTFGMEEEELSIRLTQIGNLPGLVSSTLTKQAFAGIDLELEGFVFSWSGSRL